MTFEAPPERLASQRLHLPSPPGMEPKDMNIWHFGNTADPVYMGICTVHFLVFSCSVSLCFVMMLFGAETDGRARRVRVGMGDMLWSRPVIREWNVYMIR